jgi:hypothetical protein
MKTVILTCDRCKKVLPDSEKLSEIKVIFTNASSYSYSDGRNRTIESNIKPVEWCDACMAETGFASFRKEQAATPPPDLETFIRDIMYEVACEAIQNHQP